MSGELTDWFSEENRSNRIRSGLRARATMDEEGRDQLVIDDGTYSGFYLDRMSSGPTEMPDYVNYDGRAA